MRSTRLASVHFFIGISAFLVGGIAIAILTTPDPFWWHLHFSRLGTFADFSGGVFNGTLTTAGGLMMVLSRRLHRELRVHGARSRSHRGAPVTLSGLVAVFGLHLAAVGVVPINSDGFVHDWAASGVSLSFAALLVAAPSLLRDLDRPLAGLTVPAGVILAGGYAAMVTGIINLAGFELIGFTLMFVWMSVFMGCLSPRATPAPDSAPQVRPAPVIVFVGSDQRTPVRSAHTPDSPRAVTAPITVPRLRPSPLVMRGSARGPSTRTWDARGRILHGPALFPRPAH